MTMHANLTAMVDAALRGTIITPAKKAKTIVVKAFSGTTEVDPNLKSLREL